MPQAPRPLVALLTDFGTSDAYVGIMKGVIAARCPGAHLIDITHQVSPQNIKQAAYLLRSAYTYFPAHTVFLVVVDPGVGTDRQPLALTTNQGSFVGPDNGVFSAVLDEVDTWQSVVLWPPQQLSATFQGRDIFAPAAAELANGEPLLKLGTPTVDVIRSISLYAPLVEPGRIKGEVLHIDHFGNVITNIGPLDWLHAADGKTDKTSDTHANLLTWRSTSTLPIDPAHVHVSLAGNDIAGVQTTYSTQPPGTLIAIVNSASQLEIAVNQGSAAQLTGARIGDAVSFTFAMRS